MPCFVPNMDQPGAPIQFFDQILAQDYTNAPKKIMYYKKQQVTGRYFGHQANMHWVIDSYTWTNKK